MKWLIVKIILIFLQNYTKPFVNLLMIPLKLLFFNTLQSKSAFLIMSIFLIIHVLIYFVLRRTSVSHDEFIKNENDLKFEVIQFQKIMLYLGILVPISEILYFYFNFNHSELNIPNILTGIFLIVFYILSKKSKKIYESLRYVFPIIVILYAVMSLSRLYFETDNTLSVYMDFCIVLIVSKNIFTTNAKRALFNIFIQMGLSILLLLAKIDIDFFFFLSLTLLFMSVINHIRQTTFYDTRNKYLFTNEIVNNSNNITIATNRKGEVIFCSKNIQQILGYQADEVLGLEFWRLTEDAEFKGEE